MLAAPPPFTFREGTNDEEIFDVVYTRNEYRLPDSFGPDDVVVDVGMHIGSFCYAAAWRGAGPFTASSPTPTAIAAPCTTCAHSQTACMAR